MFGPKRIAIVPILLALVAAGCGAPGSLPTTGGAASTSPRVFEGTQRNKGGEVTVEVTWDGPAAGARFDVKLDTHSVDLDALDLSDAILANDRGDSLAANPWDAPKGGHHREGRLTFTGDVVTFLSAARWIELSLNGIGAVPERVLRWEIPA